MPQAPILKGKVLSLYQAEFLSTLDTLLLVARRFSILDNITRSPSASILQKSWPEHAGFCYLDCKLLRVLLTSFGQNPVHALW